MGRTRARVVAFAAAAVALTMMAGSCTQAGQVGLNGGNPGVESPALQGSADGGPATATALTSRQVLARDVDHPPALDCSAGNWRYRDPDPTKLPVDFTDTEDYEFTSLRTGSRAGSAHSLCGQRGPALDLAWELSHGRDDVVIAVLDSGIEWRGDKMGDLATKAHLNAAELSMPKGSDRWDANGDGRFDISDYASDPRVSDRNGSGLLDPEDLILNPAFNNGVDDDRNGYIDDISGWDFLFDDNNPLDDVKYGHGTGEARDSTSADGNGGSVGTCPNCRFLPVRVGDSFIAEGGRFAAGVLFGLDSGADVIQEALGALNNPPQAQAAIDAAYDRGVPVVASMADEASKHANLPAVLDHTIAVNSVTNAAGPLKDLSDDDYLALNGCTNYGAITWITVPSSSCSSGATGLGAGMVGLIESAARTAGIAPHVTTGGGAAGDNVLSANEMAQILRGTADDVDFATPYPPVDPANDRGIDGLSRYPTTPGWDGTFGFGRINAFEAVRAVAAGEIPPEADLTSPSFFEVLPASGTLDIEADLAATRSAGFSYRVQWTTGAQAPPHPGADQWRTVATGDAVNAPVSGRVGSIDLAEVAAAIPGGATGASTTSGASDEDRFAVRIRVVVTDVEGRTAVAQRQVFVHDDPDLALNMAVPGAGAASPVFADLNADGRDEVVVGTDDGTVHALDSAGNDIAGWPRTTRPAAYWHAGSRTAVEDAISTPNAPIGVGAPVIADLDGDNRLEVAVADGNGDVTVWRANGEPLATMSVDPAFSTQSFTDSTNRLKAGFLASPAAGDLDGDGTLELVAAALDRHVYAWHVDGSPVSGFPVLVVDPARTESVDPATHHVTFNGGRGGVGEGGELVVTPAIGDITGDGLPEIVVGAQEQYTDEDPSVFPGILAIKGLGANTREYAIWGDGRNHRGPGAVGGDRYPAHPDEQAYVPGWPVKLQMIKGAVLPLIGNGVNTQAAIGNVDDDPENEVVISSAAGPFYVLDGDGRTPYARPFGLQLTLDWMGQPFGGLANSRDGGVVIAAFGGAALGDLNGGGNLEIAAPTVGIAQALDQLLPGDQYGNTQLMAWDPRTRGPLPGFPHVTRDLGFFVTPAIVDVDGDGSAEVVAAHGVSLVDAIDVNGVAAPGYPKLTGGWAVGTPGFGDSDADGRAEMAITRRDGRLMVWRTKAQTSGLGGWSRFGANGRNSGSIGG